MSDEILDETDAPDEYKCPILCEVMNDPVVAADGRTYERSAIEQWFQQSAISPMTGAVMPHCHTIVNQNLKNIIDTWRTERAAREDAQPIRNLTNEERSLLRAEFERQFVHEDKQLVVKWIGKCDPALEEKFNRKRNAIGGEIVRQYHGSTSDAALSIAGEGFRLPEPDEDGDFIGRGIRTVWGDEDAQEYIDCGGGADIAPLMYGQAVYVTDELAKVVRFAQGAIVVCDVVLGRVLKKEEGDYSMTPEKMAALGKNSIYSVPFNKEGGGTKYGEYALYDVDQVLPKFIVKFELWSRRLGILEPKPLADGRQFKVNNDTLAELAEHISDPKQFCEHLANYARDDQYMATVKLFSQSIVMETLKRAVTGHNEAAVFHALRTLWLYGVNSEVNQRKVLEMVGAPRLVSLISSLNLELRMRACGLLWTEAQHHESREALLAAGALFQAVKVFMEALKTTVESDTSAPTNTVSASITADILALEAEKAIAIANEEYSKAQELKDRIDAMKLSAQDADPSAQQPPQWGLVLMGVGMLANLSTVDNLDVVRPLAQRCQDILYDTRAPEPLTSEAMRFISLIINEGQVDEEWRKEGYRFRTSANVRTPTDD